MSTLLDSVNTKNYMGIKKPQEGEITTSAFAGRQEQSMDAALQANSIHVAAQAGANSAQ